MKEFSLVINDTVEEDIGIDTQLFSCKFQPVILHLNVSMHHDDVLAIEIRFQNNNKENIMVL